jgi:cytochrome c-type biogenesis protein CcmE
VELSPRTAPAEPGEVTPRRRRSPWAYGALVLVLVGIGVVAYQALSSASLYFYNADEAVEQRAALGDRRFRLQGSVLDDVESTSAGGVTFTVKYNGVEVPVEHDGDPPELFEPGIPVVLEGHWASSGETFASDRILVKHSEEYKAENGDRLDEAEDAGSGDSTPP